MILLLGFSSFLSAISRTQFRASAVQKLIDNTRTALEVMGREIRLAQADGTVGGCTSSGSFEIGGGGKTITFLDFDGQCIKYQWFNNSDSLDKKIGAGPWHVFLGDSTVAPNKSDIRVNDVNFSLLSGPNQQDRVTITIDIETDDKSLAGGVLRLQLQTTLSQREF